MKSKNTYNELKEIFKRIDYKIILDSGNFKSGYCLLKDKKTRSGSIVSKWIFQPDQEKNYSDFELLEKAMNIMVKEDWKLKRNEQEITIEEFINAVWEERF